MKQVSELLPIIDDSKHDDAALSAKLHGFKVKPRLKPMKISKEKKEEYNESAVSRFEQMKRDYEKNKES